VLLQIYNPIYAAGAAWLVWSVYGGLRLLGGGGVLDGLLLAVSLALSVYCGDPQSGYHAGLVLALFWLLMPGRSWRGLGALAAAGAAGAMLALVQVAVTAEFMRETTRGMDVVPVSLWDVPRFLARPEQDRADVRWYDLFIGRPPVGADQYRTLYGFPLQLHRWGEFFWPGMSGSMFGRWTVKAGLAAPDWWVSSLYAGSFTALASLVGIAAGTPGPWVRRWRIVLLLALVASLGSCGLVGLGRWLVGLVTGQGFARPYHPGDEVGGLYWLLATVAPGYAGFRYPAKWMTVAALAAGQLAAAVLDGLDATAVRRRLARLAGVCAAVQGLLVMVIVAAHGLGQTAFWPADLAEPRQAQGFWRVVTGGMHGGVAAACVAAIAAVRRDRFGEASRGALAVVLAVDLVIAGRPDILVAPWSVATAGLAPFAPLSQDRPAAAAAGGHVRIHRLAGSTFVEEFSHSLQDHVRQTAVCLTGNLPWLLGLGLVGDAGTALSRDMEVLRTARTEAGRPVAPRRFFDLAGVEFFMITNLPADIAAGASLCRDWSAAQRSGDYAGPAPAGGDLPVTGVPFDAAHPDPPLVFVCRNESALPRARIIHDFKAVRPLTPADRNRWLAMLERIAFPTADMPDLRTTAVIEADPAELGRAASVAAGPAASPPSRDRCRILVDEPQRVVVDAELAAAGMLYLADTYHRDWTAFIADTTPPRSVPTLRANRVHRAVPLPAGRHRVEFRYRSLVFLWSAVLTTAAWGAAAALLGWTWWSNRPASHARGLP
jgi:hypothetical protein